MSKLKDGLKKSLGSKNIEKVLDICTGRGTFMKVMIDTFSENTQFTGIDLKDEALEIARNTFANENINFIAMNAEILEFNDNSFDIVSLSNSLHHLPNYDIVLKEMKRVLKPDGYIIINEMFCDNQSTKQNSHVWLHHFNADIDNILGNHHDKTYTKNKLMQIVSERDFKVIYKFESQTHEDQVKNQDLDQENKTIDTVLIALNGLIEKIDDELIQIQFKETLAKQSETLYDVGFFIATSLTMICGNI